MSDRRLRDLTDEQLILEFQETNDTEIFEAIVSRYKNPLFNFVFRFLGDRDATSDVVQETFIKVYRNKDSYKTFAKFSTWIYTIAGNLAKTELQRRKRKNQISINSWGEDEETMDLPDGGPLPDRLVDSGIKNKMIQEALLKLPEVYREMVILRDIQEMSYEEIAEMMDISIGTVKSRINRGRAQLQDLLRDIFKE
ncbi:MAG: RNA polymerase sigma24 factor [Chlorobiota bacterium]